MSTNVVLHNKSKRKFTIVTKKATESTAAEFETIKAGGHAEVGAEIANDLLSKYPKDFSLIDGTTTIANKEASAALQSKLAELSITNAKLAKAKADIEEAKIEKEKLADTNAELAKAEEALAKANASLKKTGAKDDKTKS